MNTTTAATTPTKTRGVKKAATPPTARKVAAKVPAKALAKAPAKTAKPVKAVKAVAAKPAAPEAKVKVKLVRDSFTMPRNDYELIAQLKERTLAHKRATKKSELLRAGLQALAALNDKQLLAALNGLAPLKAGRPRKA